MTERNQKMRDALKSVEATVAATLAQQPEDDEKCGQFLYSALVKVRNIVDLTFSEMRKPEKKDVTDCVWYCHLSGLCNKPSKGGQCVSEELAGDIFNGRTTPPNACDQAQFLYD
jgi:hypothetical protein